MYKPLFDGTPFAKLEELLKAVKPAPKPLYLLVDKAAADLIADARRAIDALKLVPAGEEGDGTSAAELIMSAEKKADESQDEALKLVKDHLLRTALSRGYLASRVKELDLLIKVADRLVALKVAEQPAPAALKFQELVVTLKKLKKDEVPADIVELLPIYPLASFCELPAEEEVKPLFDSFKALVAEKRVFEPNDQKVCAVTVLLKLRAAMAVAKKPDKAIVKALPALEKEMTDLLTTTLDAAVKAREWNHIRQGLNASFQMNPQSPRGLEILKELDGKSPPEALELVDASKIQLPK